MRWHCHELHHRMHSTDLAGGIAVVIDVLRASTTITTALANGAAGIWPVADVAAARDLAVRLGPTALVGGERGGVKLPGFDLGNSPREYSAARVGGRQVVFTTTNGTAALAASAAAARILVGALVNRRLVATVARTLAEAADAPAVHLVCAGTDGVVSAEDVLAAGAILDAAATHGAATDELSAAAAAARAEFRRVVSGADVTAALVAALRGSRGGANLVALGMEADLAPCARLDAIEVVGHLTTGGFLQAVTSLA